MVKKIIRKRTTKLEKMRMDRAFMVNNLRANGHKWVDIAKMMGISRQAVDQIVNRHKLRARVKLRYAVKHGHIIRPNQCSKCAIQCVPQAHHDDYGLPYDVIWHCKPCHGERHKQINRDDSQPRTNT